MGGSAARHTRRRFLQGGLILAGSGLLSGCRFVPLRADPSRAYHIAGLSMPNGEASPYVDALRAGRRDHGYREGQDIALDYRTGETRQQLVELAVEVVRLEPAKLAR